MKRIHMHWTAGRNTPNHIDEKHYHFIVSGSGDVVEGALKPEANLDIRDGQYVAHTRRANTGAIGVAVAAMSGAREVPFNKGSDPITPKQLTAFVKLVAELADTYDIPVTRHTILTHAEVEPTLGIKQRGKWDITWLPGMNGPRDPIEVGDKLRGMISAELAKMQEPVPRTPKKSHVGWRSFFRNLFGGGRV